MARIADMANSNLLRFSFILGMFLGVAAHCHAQVEVEIHKVVREEGLLGIWVKCLDQGKLYNGLTVEDIRISEKLGGNIWKQLKPDDVIDSIEYAHQVSDQESSHVHFLLDVSNAMSSEQLEQAQDLIRAFVYERSHRSNVKFSFTAFHATEEVSRISMDSENVDLVLEQVRPSDAPPDFFRILMNDLRYLKGVSGSRALVVLSSGENVTSGSIYQKQLPYQCLEIAKMVKTLPYDFKILIVSFDESDLGNLDCLARSGTSYQFPGILPPEGYAEILDDNQDVVANYLIKVRPDELRFKGERRLYEVEIKGARDEHHFQMGSTNFPADLQPEMSFTEWLPLLVIGIIAILVILGVGSLLVPFVRERDFKRRYVQPYVQESNRVRYDVYYQEQIQPGQLVVAKCRQITPFTTWKENGWECPNYPVCLNSNCNGEGAAEMNNFFSMEGVFLKLNWIWFGAIGGLLGWILISLVRITDYQGLNEILSAVVGEKFLSAIDKENVDLITETMGHNVLVGMAFGAGLIFMLSWMDERRTSNQSAFRRSLIRIALRTLTGIVVSMLVFFGGFYLQYVAGVPPYVSGLISWLLFGLALGLIMSVKSTISTSNGIIGGIFGSAVAFHAYWFLLKYYREPIEANLVSMILLGGLIGSILVSIVTSLEDYELQVVSPHGYQRTIPISKWLKSRMGVLIGKAPGSYVYIKWDDEEVRPEHAELFVQNGDVFLRPIAEVLLNQRLVTKPMPLRNGDLIRLGRSSITQLRFVERQ